MGRGGEKVTQAKPSVGINNEKTYVKFDRKEFYLSSEPEPHKIRRKAILEKHPEIVDLMKPDSRPVPYVIAIVALQLIIAANAQYMSWPVWCFFAYVFGGTISHSLALMTHECSHNLVFENMDLNYYFAVFANIGMGIPSAASFKVYHMEHHQFQGSIEKDVDIPSVFEGHFFKGLLGKLLFVILQPVLYGGRPSIVRPKDLSKKIVFNAVAIVLADALLVYTCGLGALVWLIVSMFIGFGLHPLAGHLIAEHYVFDGNGDYETYSYYGIFNKFAWNVGYHNEHHDFPRVPGWRLPEVKRIAPEFYDNLPQCDCWVMTIVRFITDPTVSPFCRVRRT